MTIRRLLSTASILLGVQSLLSGCAVAQWRTPPIKTEGAETVSCDLVNSAGQDITVTNIIIRVQTLEGDASREVVNVPTLVIKDGRGVRGSSPVSTLAFRTVYCEIDKGSVIPVKKSLLFFTMTVKDAAGKAVTVAGH
jgi:hypothetical protein